MGQRDLSFRLDEAAVADARPPFRPVELLRRLPPWWTIRDGANRAAVRALYALREGPP